MELLKRINEFLNNGFALVGGITLVSMMIIACVNMGMRLMGSPISAAFELVGYFGALTVSLPLGYAQIKKSHIAVDILSSHFPPAVRRLVRVVGLALGTVFFCVAAWQLFSHAETLRRAGEVSETLRVPYYPFIYGVSAGCGLMTLCLVVDFLTTLFPGDGDSTGA